MGPAIDALQPAVAVTGRNPTYLAAALVTLAASGASSLVVGRIPVLGELVNSLLVTPALAALLIGMAAAGLATDAASLGDGVESLRASYRSLVGAYAVLIAAILLLVVAWAVEVGVAVLLGAGGDVSGIFAAVGRSAAPTAVDPTVADPTSVRPAPLSMGPETAAPVLILTLLALAVALVGGLAVQFFDVAIVVGGASALASFGDSWRLFREAPASVIGYSALRLLPVVAAGLLVAAAYWAGASLAGSIAGGVGALVVAVAVGPITFAFVTAYHVAYYEERVDGRGDGDTRHADQHAG